jgi:hypothetical protein
VRSLDGASEAYRPRLKAAFAARAEKFGADVRRSFR